MKPSDLNGYETQRSSKEKHRGFIIRSLEKEPLLFSELLDLGKEDANGIKSPMGLSRILDEMQKGGSVNQDATKKDSRGIARKAYCLSNKGKKEADELWYISYTIDELKRLNADHTRHEEIATIHGLDGDVIFHKVAPKIRDIINDNLDDFGKYFVRTLSEKIKQGKLSISDNERWQKGVIALEFNMNDIVYALNCGLKLIEDLRVGKDILKDKAFYLGNRPYSLFALDRAIRWAEVHEDKEFPRLLSVFFKKYANMPEEVKNDFGLDLNLSKQIAKIIMKDNDPLIVLEKKLEVAVKEDNERIAKLLGGSMKWGSLDYNSFLDRNVVLAQLINYNNKKILSRLRMYQKTLFKGDKHMGHTAIINFEEARPM